MRRRSLLALAAAAAALVGTRAPVAAALGKVSYRLGTGRSVDAPRVLPLYRGTRTTVTLEGPSVETCERVELGPAVSVPAERLARAAGRITFDAVTDAAAPLGPRELRLRYAIELAGPETFPARVLRGGVVETASPRRASAGKPVVVTFTGRDLGNADVLASDAYRDARVLPGGTETRCSVEITFVKEGAIRVALYDRDGPPLPPEGPHPLGGHTTRPDALVEVVRAGEKP